MIGAQATGKFVESQSEDQKTFTVNGKILSFVDANADIVIVVNSNLHEQKEDKKLQGFAID